MHRERFHAQRRSKLLPMGDGLFQVLERINDNDYKLDLPSENNVSANPFQEEGNDGGMTKEWSADPLEILLGPITRAKAERFKEALNLLIQDA